MSPEFFSRQRTEAPSSEARRAAHVPAVPEPTTTISKSSVLTGLCVEGLLSACFSLGASFWLPEEHPARPTAAVMPARALPSRKFLRVRFMVPSFLTFGPSFPTRLANGRNSPKWYGVPSLMTRMVHRTILAVNVDSCSFLSRVIGACVVEKVRQYRGSTERVGPIGSYGQPGNCQSNACVY